jgi:Protein of unknown function (DUF1553)/Protein of unknown function (DUF1549)/Planctomycete cytochrome C
MSRPGPLRFSDTLLVVSGSLLLHSLSCIAGDDIQFSRDIQPILATNCLKCHGADDELREADLRLDRFDDATAELGGYAAVVPGDPAKSSLVERITTDDSDLRMPPPDTGKTLSADDIAKLTAWIANGAEYQQHWSFVPPVRPDIPGASDNVDRRPIDAFVQDRLEREGLQPSPVADKATRLRRLSLDVIGLPPTIEELDAFLNDTSPVAWQRQIDRLLSSPHYGEKWGRHWLDAARYADSDGFEKDKPRFVWFYRDWVVKALNQDMPYDQFIIEQLAGDLLPNRTQDQLVATGFLRNSMINEEGGVDPEQFRMEAMFDRMDAIGKAVLGITIQCTQCHDHKYDPLTQRDYYQMFAFLNNCDESQATVYTDQQMATRDRVLEEIAALEKSLRREHSDWPAAMAKWEDAAANTTTEWSTVRPQLDASGGQKHYLLEDGSVLAQGYAPTKHTTQFTVDTDKKNITGFRLELLNDPNLPHNGPGRSIFGTCAVSEFQVSVQTRDDPPKNVAVKWASATADVNPKRRDLESVYDDKAKKQRVTGPIEFAIDGDNLTAWGIDIGGGRSNVPRNAVFIPEESLTSESGFRITFKLVQMHGGWNSDDNQNNNLGRFRFSITSHVDPAADTVPPDVRRAIATDADARTQQQRDTVFSYWRKTVKDFSAENDQIEQLWKQHPWGHTQLVLHERDDLRRTHVLTRGDFLKPADEVQADVPSLFGDIPASASRDRLTFARWIANRNAPTTARAIVNRIWQEYFGTGIVSTAEDLGTQGEYPSHPKLLDWLASELMDNNWSLKHVHRLIASSDTYQQLSHVTPELLSRDPDNRLLARGPRFRVNGETIRDIFLAASGLLNHDMGGPGVYPPAPAFLFQPPVSYGPKTWNTATDGDRYRRAIYTFRFRSVPYPVLQNFDTQRGDISCVRRVRSNTPLQALTSLNEDLFMESCRALALSAVRQDMPNDSERLDFVFRRCVSRYPTDDERATLLSFLNSQQTRMETDGPSAAWQLAADDPEQLPELPDDVTAATLAAWTATCRVILNLDETITKE